MTSRTLYHASTVDGITRFNDNSHFAFDPAPCMRVLARKFFGDTQHIRELLEFKPRLYICHVDIEESQLDTYHDLKSPFVGALFGAWRDRFLDRGAERAGIHQMSSDKRLEYNRNTKLRCDLELGRAFYAQKGEVAQTAWMKERLAEEGFVGYRYVNDVEGGESICLLDCSKVTITEVEHLSRHAIATEWLASPEEPAVGIPYHSLGIGAGDYRKAFRRARCVLKMKDTV